jgi:hypothetical protein
MSLDIDTLKAWAGLHFLPKYWLLFSNTKLGRWYDTNGYFRFKPGDVIRLRHRWIAGYGPRTEGKVLGYATREDVPGKPEDVYDIAMIAEDAEKWPDEEFEEYWNKGAIPEHSQQDVNREFHSKWNIEHHFRRVRRVA